MSEQGDLQCCEHCGKEFPIEDMMMMGDSGFFCECCYAEWKVIFDSCNHQWEPQVDEMGDDGQYCTRCSGFVVNESFPDLFGKPAPEPPSDPPEGRRAPP